MSITKKIKLADIAKQLAIEMPGFRAKGSLLVLMPLHHTLRGICLERSGTAKQFYVWVFLQPLFVPSEHITFNIGWRVGGGCHTWSTDAEGLTVRLTAALKKEAYPFLSGVNTLRDLADATMSLNKTGDLRVQEAIVYISIRLLAVSQAKIEIKRLRALLHPRHFDWQREMLERVELFEGLLESDAVGLENRFNSCESETAENLGLTQLKCGIS